MENDPLALSARRQKLFDLAIVVGLLLTIAVVYAQVADFEFVSYDDPGYVQNAHVLTGLTAANIKWALSAVVVSNWLPVTMLSYMLDAQLFGTDSGASHLVNVVLHALSAILLYLALRRATNARGLSTFVAFVFALHPLHVESVAWVAERKDVLSTFFWFLALYAYVRYAERPGLGRYMAVAVPFCLGLLSKPMLVTFPFTLWLLDLWPLRRTDRSRAIWEKLPLIALSFGVAVVAYTLQGSTGAMMRSPFPVRIANAFISYVVYIRQMFWPANLACYYPLPFAIPLWKAVACAIAVLIVTVLAIGTFRTRPYLTVGWLWFIGTLVPVIGVVQVGGQAHADRYMYVPMVGLSIALAWGVADAIGNSARANQALAAAGVIICLACMVAARSYTAYWRESGTLFEKAIDSTGDNDLMENNLGDYMAKKNRPADAVMHFEAAVRVNPRYALAQSNLGAALEAIGGCTAALPHYAAAVQINPDDAGANFNLGNCLAQSHDYLGAAPYFAAAVRAKPDFADAHFWLGKALSEIPGRETEALKEFEAALQLRPRAPQGMRALGSLLGRLGRKKEAIAQFEAAQAIDPDPETQRMLESLRASP